MDIRTEYCTQCCGERRDTVISLWPVFDPKESGKFGAKVHSSSKPEIIPWDSGKLILRENGRT